MQFETLPEYDKDLKRLLKKFRTLEEDIEILKKVLAVQPKESPPLSFRLTGYKEEYFVVKVKKITCRALKGRGANSGLRLIYEYKESEGKIVLVEIYFKGADESENKERLQSYYGK